MDLRRLFQTPKERYDLHYNNVSKNLAEIRSMLLTIQVDNPDWSHVGSMAELDDKVQEIHDMLYKEGEYSE